MRQEGLIWIFASWNLKKKLSYLKLYLKNFLIYLKAKFNVKVKVPVYLGTFTTEVEKTTIEMSTFELVKKEGFRLKVKNRL